MKRAVRFQSTRYYFFAFSATVFILGATFYFLHGGLNLGVDFKSGITLQFQIAPASFTLQYSGKGTADVSLPVGEQALTSAGDFIVETTDPLTSLKTTHPFKFADYKSVQELVNDVAAKVPGVAFTKVGDMSVPPSSIVPPVNLADISGKSYTFNIQPQPGVGTAVTMSDVRSTLSPLGQFDLQQAGKPEGQEFIAKVEAPSKEDPAFQTATQQKLVQLLAPKFGADQIVMKSTNYVGARVSQALSRQSVWLVVVALFLILIYLILRFKPIYAVAAVLALFHDALLMLSYNSVFHIEVDTGTVAAILTILGYSINDTIVIFDRVRENLGLMRGQGLETILDTSVTQNLVRTGLTSGATMLAVIALFALTTGSIKIFALNMLVGIIEGSYSTVFIASPIVLEWENYQERRRRRIEAERFGIKTTKPVVVEDPELDEEEEDNAEPLSAEALSVKTEAEVQAEHAAEVAAAAPSDGQSVPQVAENQNADDAAKGKILSYPGGQSQGYRFRHKRHKGRHHH